MSSNEIESVRYPDDANTDLETMADSELRQVIDTMKASRRRPTPTRLDDQGYRDAPRTPGRLPTARAAARPDFSSADGAEAATRRPERSRASARRRFLALLQRVPGAAGSGHAESLAEFIAIDLVDSRSIGRFREVARGIREGTVDPEVVKAAYKAAKGFGVERPGALFLSVVTSRSPGLARARVPALF